VKRRVASELSQQREAVVSRQGKCRDRYVRPGVERAFESTTFVVIYNRGNTPSKLALKRFVIKRRAASVLRNQNTSC
jgi:hypothetical protein